jgi:hypothetical protein
MGDRDPTDVGVFHYADTYLRAGRALSRVKRVRSTHPDAPVQFLYYHAIELFLKSFLMLHGYTAEQLRERKFGHRVKALAAAGVEKGLHLDDEDTEVIDLMADGENHL